MTNPNEIWGIRGEPSGGAGVGGPEPATPDPDGTYADCNPIVPDVPAALPDTQTWVNVAACSSPTTATDEWVLQDDATYFQGSVWRVSKFNLGSTETCVVVTGIRTVELIADGAPGIGTFPATGGAAIICGPYATCAECTASCYSLTPCLGGTVLYSRNTALAALVGMVTVVAGACYTVGTTDKDNCCPAGQSDVLAAGSYADCDVCDEAINPLVEPCNDCNGTQPTATISTNASGCTHGNITGGAVEWAAFNSNPSRPGAACSWTWSHNETPVRTATVWLMNDDTYDVSIVVNGTSPDQVVYEEEDVSGFSCNGTSGILQGSASVAFQPLLSICTTSGPATFTAG